MFSEQQPGAEDPFAQAVAQAILSAASVLKRGIAESERGVEGKFQEIRAPNRTRPPRERARFSNAAAGAQAIFSGASFSERRGRFAESDCGNATTRNSNRG